MLDRPAVAAHRRRASPTGRRSGSSALALLVCGSVVVRALRLGVRDGLAGPPAALARANRDAWREDVVIVVGGHARRRLTCRRAGAAASRLDSGEPFQERDLLIFLTICVILVTLVGQGLTLPWVLRVLRRARRWGRGAGGGLCARGRHRRPRADRIEALASEWPDHLPLIDTLRASVRPPRQPLSTIAGRPDRRTRHVGGSVEQPSRS